MSEKNIRNEVEDILTKLLEDLKITKKELLYEKFFCIRRYYGKPMHYGKFMACYMPLSVKAAYPKGVIAKEAPDTFDNINRYQYSFEEENRKAMTKVYRKYILKDKASSNEDVYQACCECIEILYSGLISGFFYTFNDIADNIFSKEIKEYLEEKHSNHKKTKKHFTALDDSLPALRMIRTVEELKQYAVDEIKKFLNKQVYCVFIPVGITEDDYVEDMAKTINWYIEKCLSNAVDKSSKEKILEKVKKNVNSL